MTERSYKNLGEFRKAMDARTKAFEAEYSTNDRAWQFVIAMQILSVATAAAGAITGAILAGPAAPVGFVAGLFVGVVTPLAIATGVVGIAQTIGSLRKDGLRKTVSKSFAATKKFINESIDAFRPTPADTHAPKTQKAANHIDYEARTAQQAPTELTNETLKTGFAAAGKGKLIANSERKAQKSIKRKIKGAGVIKTA